MNGKLKLAAAFPPLVALAIVAGGLGIQKRAISSAEGEHDRLKTRVATAQPPAVGGNPSLVTATRDFKPVDWKMIGLQLSEMRHSGGTGDIRPLERLMRRIDTMTPEDLIAALAEIAALDLSESSSASLEKLLIRALFKKDPELVFTRFADYLRTDRETIGWQFANAFQDWVQKDQEKATAWLDLQIAAGNFHDKSLDGKNRSRSRFEAGLFGILFSTDADAAFRRLGAIPEKLRDDVLESCEFTPLKRENQLAAITLARERLSEEQIQSVMTRQSILLVSKEGFTKVGEFLDRVSATPTERSACAGEAAEARVQQISNERKITRDDIDALRQWVGTQAPDSTAKITGAVIAEIADGYHNLEFAEAAELAVHYHQTSDTDEVLQTFLQSQAASSHKEQALILADKIRDDSRRTQVLEFLK